MQKTNVVIIPAKPKIQQDTKAKTKLRVAAYCRVSTETEEQALSYEAQIKHYTEYINSREDWTLAGIYADDGISGTRTKERFEFRRMIDDAMEGKIDYIITKSISRFARNTLDCLRFIRKLKEKSIPVYFEKEGINTMDSKGEVLLTIMASLAQQESQSLSQNVKMGLQYRYQQGKVLVNHKRFLGYGKDEEGNLVVIPDEAKTIRRIFREYLEGQSPYAISKGLESDGILTGAGKKKWYDTTIRKILQNEKYMGDALLQKTYTVDFLSKRRVKNSGEMPQYYVENNHEAIVPRNIFYAVQEEMLKRQNGRLGKNGVKRHYSSNNCFSNIVICANCGDVFRRVHWNNRGKKSIVWRCISRLENRGTKCTARTLPEDELIEATVEAFKRMLTEKNEFLNKLMDSIQSEVTVKPDRSLYDIEEELDALQLQLISRTYSKEDYDDLVEKIYTLKDEKEHFLHEEAGKENHCKNLKAIEEFIQTQDLEDFDFDEKLVRQFIDKILILDKEIEVTFRTGASVRVVG